jgi:hypothetical protein
MRRRPRPEIDKLQLAVEWVLLHPGEEVDRLP